MEEATRQINKASKLLQKELANYFQRQITERHRGVLVSVTKVRISRDFSIAKAYLSIFPNEICHRVIKEIKLEKPQIRHQISRKIKNLFRKIPEFYFYVDDSIDYYEKIDRALKGEIENPLLNENKKEN